jgi:hypothetical protein
MSLCICPRVLQIYWTLLRVLMEGLLCHFQTSMFWPKEPIPLSAYRLQGIP